MSAAPKPPRRSARDRLLETADRLFYAEGIHNVGIDRVLAESGVAKGSLYYNFSGKDELVGTYLHDRHARWAARIDEELASAPTPEAKILAVFDALAALFAEPGFNGCTFLNAAAEAAPGSPEDLATKDFRTWLHDLFGDLVDAAHFPQPGKLAAQLVMLYDGANIAARMDHNPAVAVAARDAAVDLLDRAASPSERRRRR